MAYDQNSNYSAPQRPYYTQRAPNSTPYDHRGYEQNGHSQENGQYGYNATSPYEKYNATSPYDEKYNASPMNSQAYGGQYEQPYMSPPQTYPHRPQQPRAPPTQSQPQLHQRYGDVPAPGFQQTPQVTRAQAPMSAPSYQDNVRHEQNWPRKTGPTWDEPPTTTRRVDPVQQSQSYHTSPKHDTPVPAAATTREVPPDKQSSRPEKKHKERTQPAIRKPLMDPASPTSLSQDNAFPVFPTKKEVAKNKSRDSAGATSIKDRSSDERTRPSTATNASKNTLRGAGERVHAQETRDPDPSSAHRAKIQHSPPRNEHLLMGPPPAQFDRRFDATQVSPSEPSPASNRRPEQRRYLEQPNASERSQRAEPYGQPEYVEQSRQYDQSAERAHRDGQQGKSSQSERYEPITQHDQPGNHVRPEHFGHVGADSQFVQRVRNEYTQPEQFGWADYDARAAPSGYQEQYIQSQDDLQSDRHRRPAQRPYPEQYNQPEHDFQRQEDDRPMTRGRTEQHRQPEPLEQLQPYGNYDQYNNNERSHEPQHAGYADRHDRFREHSPSNHTQRSIHTGQASRDGSGFKRQGPISPLQSPYSPSAGFTTPVQTQQPHGNGYKTTPHAGMGDMSRTSEKDHSMSRLVNKPVVPAYDEASRFNAARLQQLPATGNNQARRQETKPLHSLVGNDAMYQQNPWVDPRTKHESLGDVYADHLADGPPTIQPTMSAPADRDAQIEANMPDFDSLDSRQTAHRRGLTVDRHLNEVQSIASPPPMPSISDAAKTHPVAYRKPVYQDPRNIQSQPDDRAADAVHNGMSGFEFDVPHDANQSRDNQYDQASHSQRPTQSQQPAQYQPSNWPTQRQQVSLPSPTQQSNWTNQDHRPQWPGQNQQTSWPDQSQQAEVGYDARGLPADLPYGHEHALQQRSMPAGAIRPQTAGPGVPSHRPDVEINGHINQMQMRGSGQRPAPGGRAPSAPPLAPKGRPGFQQANTAGPFSGRPQQQMFPSQESVPPRQQPQRPGNPDALPAHPPPVRPGLIEQSPPPPLKPPPVRQYNSTGSVTKPVSTKSRTPTDDRQRPVPVTNADLDRLRAKVDANPRDYETALLLAKKLVEAASVLASDNGRLDAKATAKNRERFILDAHKRIKKLVGASYPEAMFYLADCYGQGLLGLEVDTKEAFTLYQSAAKGGHAASAYRTAVCCEMGPEEGGGTRKDITKAVQWYRRAAQLQDVAAMYKLGIILLKGLLGQQKNVAEAVVWLKRAAERADVDHPHALHELGVLHEPATVNSAVRDKVIPDEAYARELFIKAANLGYKFSQFRLGQAYEYGNLGLPIDSRKSIAWYSKAAAQGEHNAELALSGWYLTGADGILKHSDTEAYLWARKAASSEPPLAKAMFAMGYYTENAIGCPSNMEEAKKWYGRAASYKFPQAIQKLEEIRKGKAAKPTPNHGRLRRDQRKDEAECVVM